MSEDSIWAKRCRYAALANIFSVMLLAFVLIKTLMNFAETKGEINPSLISFEAKYHLIFLFVAILTILMRTRISTRLQQALTVINALMAVYMTINAINFWSAINA